MGLLRLAFVLPMLVGVPALAHEFWIEPAEYQVESGAEITAALRNGQIFDGISLGYFDNRFTRFEMVMDGAVAAVPGRMGDTPALQAVPPAGNGLLVILHETTPSTLTYKEWDKFLAFADHKDFRDAEATHDARGWSKEGFRESYTRHAKALVAVGDGQGSDRVFGLATEFVALTNPYAQDFDGTMRVRVEDAGQPRANAQVEVFARAPDDTVAVTLHRTDSSGEASIPVSAGFEYLFDAVILRPSPQAGSSDTAPVWETLWAALTFAVPDR